MQDSKFAKQLSKYLIYSSLLIITGCSVTKFDLGLQNYDDGKYFSAIYFFNRAIWDDPEYLEIPLKTEDEQRVLIIGRIGEKHWSGIITYREDRIRIISVRRSRSEEVVLYES